MQDLNLEVYLSSPSTVTLHDPIVKWAYNAYLMTVVRVKEDDICETLGTRTQFPFFSSLPLNPSTHHPCQSTSASSCPQLFSLGLIG